jgi:hypothetical protein
LKREGNRKTKHKRSIEIDKEDIEMIWRAARTFDRLRKRRKVLVKWCRCDRSKFEDCALNPVPFEMNGWSTNRSAGR